MPSLLKSEKLWRMAVAAENKYWAQNRPLIDEMRGNYSNETIWKVLKQYDAIRTFPTINRPAFERRFRSLSDKFLFDKNYDDFDMFVKTCRDLAESAKKTLRSPKGNTRRPLSGSSKLLWHRAPTRGFIFDNTALLTLKKAGLKADYKKHLKPWGGPDRGGERNFLAFSALHKEYLYPLYDPISKIMKQFKREPMRASCVVDKLLWQENSRKEINVSKDDREIAMQIAEYTKNYIND